MLFFFILTYSSITYAANYELISSVPISAGLTKDEYRITGDGNHYANVLVCDLTNPFIQLEVIAGRGEYNQRATVTEMAYRTGASAVTNGDFFNMRLEGTPNGPSIVDGKIQSSPCVLEDVYSLGIDENNTAQITQIGFKGELQTPSGRIYPIDGVNKSYYWYEPDLQYSHENKLQVYTDFWAATTRGDANNSEILVNSEGVVEDISENKRFNFQVPDGKYIIQASGTAMDFIKTNVTIGGRVNIVYNLTPDINWKFLIGGHALLVDGGEVIPYTKDLSALEGNRARTAAGISSDGKKIYIASVEGRTWRSNGMRLNQLSNFMKAIGSSRAVNLDGGGSTAMVVKQGENYNRTINPENNGYERKVVNGIGIFSNAVPGELVGFEINGPDQLNLGETQYYDIGKGWDGNGNFVSAEGYGYSLEVDSDLAVANGNYITALKPGIINLKIIRTDGKESIKTINILPSTNIIDIAIDTSQRRISDGESLSFNIKGKLPDGSIIDLNNNPAILQLYGIEGEISKENKTIKIDKVLDKQSHLGLTFGDKETSQTFYDKSHNVIEMFVGNKEYKLNEELKEMDTEVFTENGRTMLPVRFIIEALNGDVNWDEQTSTVLIGYKNHNIQIPIGSEKMLVDGREIYMDSKSILKDGRTFVPIRYIVEQIGIKIGYRAFDERITIVDENPLKETDKIINMNIGSRKYTVNNELKEMDTEVFTENGRTMIPMRFIIESIGANVDWDAENFIAILRYKGQKIDIPVDRDTIIVDGIEKKIDSKTILKDGRLFVPIRFIAESLGMKISYRPIDERVTIYKND